MAYETIKYEVSDQILTITLNRPEKLNAFNATMQQELIDAFDRAAANSLQWSNPTTPLPPEYPSPTAFFTVTFYYNEQPPSQ